MTLVAIKNNFTAYSHLPSAISYLPSTISPSLHLYKSTTLRLIAICYLPFAICYLLSAICYLLSAICHLLSAICYPLQILAVSRLYQRLCKCQQLLLIDISHAVGHFLYGSDFHALTLFYNQYKLSGLHQRLDGPCIQPCCSPIKHPNLQLAPSKILFIDVRYLQFATRRWFQSLRDPHHVIVVKVYPGHRVVRLRLFWLLLDRNDVPFRIKLNYTIALRIVYGIGKNHSPIGIGTALQQPGHTRSVEDIV